MGPWGREGSPGEKGRRGAEGSPGPDGPKGDRVSMHVVFKIETASTAHHHIKSTLLNTCIKYVYSICESVLQVIEKNENGIMQTIPVIMNECCPYFLPFRARLVFLVFLVMMAHQ